MRRIRTGALVLGLLPLLGGGLRAGDHPRAQDWQITGDSTTKVDYMGNDGNAAVSPFRFEDAHFLTNLSLNFERNLSPFERLHGQMLGRVNASEYVRDHRGVIVDRFSLTWEKGDGKVPFRLTAGDHFAFLTPRTIRRSLKGLSWELQPPGSRDQSVLLFTGANQPSYRDIDTHDEVYHGASWLLRFDEDSSLSFNVVNAHRNGRPGIRALDQTVTSVNAGHLIRSGRSRLAMDAEFALLGGDHVGAPNATGPTAGKGYFYRLDGSDGRRLSYFLRREDYEDDFQPLGASVLADQRTDNWQAAYQLPSGWRLEARLNEQNLVRSTADPQDRLTRGFRAAGPLQLGTQRGRMILDSFRVRGRSTSLAVDNESRVHNLSVSTQIGPWASTFSFLNQDDLDHTTFASALQTRSYTLNGTRPMAAWGYAGSWNAGVQYRTVTGRRTEGNLGFNLGLDMTRGIRFLQASWRHFYQDFPTAPGTDVVTRDLQVRVGKRWGEKQLALELGSQTRLSDQVANNNAWRVGLVYGVRFGNRGRSFDATVDQGRTPVAPVPTSGDTRARELDLTQLVTGVRVADARAYVQGFGFERVEAAPSVDRYEDRFLHDLGERQRLFLLHGDGHLQRAALVVDAGTRGSAQDAETLLGRVLDRLNQRYGSPEMVVEEGDFGPNMVADLTNGRLIRTYQWKTPFGQLRLGIPRRLDRQIRIEIHHGRSLGAARDIDWSIETFR